MRFVASALIAAAATWWQAGDLGLDRREFATWLRTSPVSPYAAIYHQPFAGELLLGAGGEPGLGALPPARLTERRSAIWLRTDAGERAVARDRPVAVGQWQVRVSGDPGRRVVSIFGPVAAVEPPGWYPPNGSVTVVGALETPDRRENRRMLGLDGIEIDAQLAGTFVATLGARSVRLLVYRMPEPGSEEEELMIFFRDSTNSGDTYPAGRFLTLEPLGGSRYRADFNRARNPFCAYNGVFPCPLPWPGNAVAARIEAGEKYSK